MLDAGVIDRHYDPERKGRRTLTDLCVHYGIEIGNAHEAAADATAQVKAESEARAFATTALRRIKT